MVIREALAADLKWIEVILTSFNLPAEDCEAHLPNFFIVEEDNRVIAVGGLEIFGKSGLVRSIAVISEYQGKRIGEMVYQRIEERAKALGMTQLFLLTDTAVQYFERFSFTKIRRSDTPVEIVATRQFRELCPDSATVMVSTLV